MDNPNLLNLWIDNEIKYQRQLKDKLHRAYNALKEKETKYAQWIWKMYVVRCEILDLLNTKLELKP